MGIDQAKEIMDKVVLLALRQCQDLNDVRAILAAWDKVQSQIKPDEEQDVKAE